MDKVKAPKTIEHKKSFSIGEAVKFGLNTVKKNLIFFIGLGLISGLINYAPSILKLYIPKDQGMLISLIGLASWILPLGILLGFLHIALRFVDGKKPEFSDLFSQFKPQLLINYSLAGLFYFFAMLVGFLLLIIPGIIIMVRCSFYGFALVDKNIGSFHNFQSLRMSWKITKGNFGKLFLFGLAMIGINSLSLLTLIVGYWAKTSPGINSLSLLTLVVGLFTFPLFLLSSAYVYRKLSS